MIFVNILGQIKTSRSFWTMDVRWQLGFESINSIAGGFWRLSWPSCQVVIKVFFIYRSCDLAIILPSWKQQDDPINDNLSNEATSQATHFECSFTQLPVQKVQHFFATLSYQSKYAHTIPIKTICLKHLTSHCSIFKCIVCFFRAMIACFLWEFLTLITA